MNIRTLLHLLPLAAFLLGGSMLLSSCDDADKKPAAGKKAAPTLSDAEFRKQFMLVPMEAQLIVHSSLSAKEQAKLIHKDVIPKTHAVTASSSKEESYRPTGEIGNIMMVAAIEPYENEEELMAVLMAMGEKYGVNPQEALNPGKKLFTGQQKLVDEVKLACMGISPKSMKMEKDFTPETAAAEMKAIYQKMADVLTGEETAEKKAEEINELIVRCARLGAAISYDDEFYKKTQEALLHDDEMKQAVQQACGSAHG